MDDDSSAPMPASGSSSSSNLGRVASVIAISSWRCSPCDSALAGLSARASSPATASASRAVRLTSANFAAGRKKRIEDLCRDWAASRQFSNAVNERNTLVFW